jgi:ATP-dependent DNA helicase RecG
MLRNPYLADIFHKLGLLDAWGTGISEMQRQVEDARLRPVDFEFDNFFTVTFWRPRNVTPDMEKTRVKPKRDLLFQERTVPEDARVEKPVREEPEKRPPEKTAPANVFDSDLKENLAEKFNFRGQQLERVFALLKDIFRGKALDYDKFEKKFDVSTKTIKRDIKKLKDLDMVTFEGAPKTGKYVMTPEGTNTVKALAEE